MTKIKKLFHFAIRTPFRNRTETSRRPSPLSRFSSNAYCEVYPKEGGDDEAQGKSVRKGADEKDPVIAPSPGKLFFCLGWGVDLGFKVLHSSLSYLQTLG